MAPPFPSLGVLWDAIESAAIQRGHRPADVARYVGLHPAHYYRIRKSPSHLARCHLDVLRRFGLYIDWSVLDIFLGAGLIDPADLWTAQSSSKVLLEALEEVAVSRFASGLATPIRQAAKDHQLLIARLHIAVLAGAVAQL